MMNLNDIKNLEDLRLAKRELKQQMSQADRDAKDGFLYSTINKLFSKVEDNVHLQSSPIGNGVHSALNFVSDQAQKKFHIGNTGKTLISIGVVIAAPLIAKKIQQLIDEKF